MVRSGTSFKDVTTLADGVNLYGPKSMDKIREAANVASFIRKRLVSEAQEGNSTAELESLAESLLKEHNCTPLFKGMYGFPYITCMSKNDTIVHGFPDSDKLKKGDVLSIDIGLRHSNGFCADNARTVIVGGLEGSNHREIVELGKKAFSSGLEAAVPGNTTTDVGRAIFRDIVQKRVDGDFKKPSVYKIFDKFRGHGIGLDLHEEPSIPNWGAPGGSTILQEGMCICIEPVIMYNSSKVLKISTNNVAQYKTHDGQPSSHYENQVLITKDGPIVIT